MVALIGVEVYTFQAPQEGVGEERGGRTKFLGMFLPFRHLRRNCCCVREEEFRVLE